MELEDHNVVMNTVEPHALILNWYDQHRRVLPWRALPGEVADPYRVWLSEIMLQQTTVATVKNRYEAFMSQWPTVNDLAAATLDEVLSEWAGLGYYARARNLHKCASKVAKDMDGVFPQDEMTLKTLPGIGDYTAAAIASIAFEQPAVVVDGNVERVISRLFRINEALPGAKKPIKAQAALLTPQHRAGDYAQAMMDLGATLCTPKNPKCALCPVQSECEAFGVGDQEKYPVKAPKKKRPTRRGTICWMQRDGATGPEVWVRRRPEKGLLGGMMEFPSSEWQEGPATDVQYLGPEWRALAGQVIHIFTHFRLELDVVASAQAETHPFGNPSEGDDLSEGRWVGVDQLNSIALPTVMTKVVDLVAAETAGD
jgi:A/G-specific adenine glycosylase